MKDLRPNEQRAKNALTLLWIMLGLEIISLISSGLQYNLLSQISDFGSLTPEEADANDTREGIIGIMYLIAYIISVVTFIMWFRRAYYNLHLRAKNLSYSDDWAAGSWFVPFMNLVRPYKIMKELYERTIDLYRKNGVKLNFELNSSIVGWWWTFWIVSNIIGNITFRITNSADTVDELLTATTFSIFNYLLGIPLALLAIRVIKDYAKAEPFLAKLQKPGEVQEKTSIEQSVAY